MECKGAGYGSRFRAGHRAQPDNGVSAGWSHISPEERFSATECQLAVVPVRVRGRVRAVAAAVAGEGEVAAEVEHHE